MLKQQASLLQFTKLNLLYKSLSKKNLINQHSVYIKSALIIVSIKSCIQVMINMMELSFMFLGFFFKTSSDYTLKRKQEWEICHMKFHSSFSSQRLDSFVQQNMSKEYKKHPDVYNWRRVGVECTNYGAQAVSRYASPSATTVSTTSATQRGTTHYGFFWSSLNCENTPEWIKLLVCALHSWEQSYLPLHFSWDLQWELRA